MNERNDGNDGNDGDEGTYSVALIKTTPPTRDATPSSLIQLSGRSCTCENTHTGKGGRNEREPETNKNPGEGSVLVGERESGWVVFDKRDNGEEKGRVWG